MSVLQRLEQVPSPDMTKVSFGLDDLKRAAGRIEVVRERLAQVDLRDVLGEAREGATRGGRVGGVAGGSIGAGVGALHGATIPANEPSFLASGMGLDRIATSPARTRAANVAAAGLLGGAGGYTAGEVLGRAGGGVYRGGKELARQLSQRPSLPASPPPLVKRFSDTARNNPRLAAAAAAALGVGAAGAGAWAARNR